MATLGGTATGTDDLLALSRLRAREQSVTDESRLGRVHAFLRHDAPERVRSMLDDAHDRALSVARAGGANSTSDAAAAAAYASDVVVGLAAYGELDATDTRLAAAALSETCGVPLAAARLDLFTRCAASPRLLELPPTVAMETLLRMLRYLDIVREVSVWHQGEVGDVTCVVAVGVDPRAGTLRNEAQRAIRGRRGVHLGSASVLRSARIARFGAVVGVVVARLTPEAERFAGGYLDVAAAAIGPLLEREMLLERSAARERAIVGNAENRLTRLGFDLHDGPVQDVLALAAETRSLRDELYPFVIGEIRELVPGRFDDLVARIADINLQLREIAHALESRSIVSRPLGEVLHREIEAFGVRSGIDASLRLQGDPESLSSQQRVALFRAIQEALTNVREHSGAKTVSVQLTVGKRTVDVTVRDDGHGFEVNRSLALAAERGRLGLVGMAERMRMLGGTFDVQSKTGGPTTIRFSLPLWEPITTTEGTRR